MSKKERAKKTYPKDEDIPLEENKDEKKGKKKKNKKINANIEIDNKNNKEKQRKKNNNSKKKEGYSKNNKEVEIENENYVYKLEEEEKYIMEEQFKKFKEEDLDIFENETENINLENTENENEIKEDFTKGIELNDYKLLGKTSSDNLQKEEKIENSLNNATNPFIKEENKSKYYENIEIIDEKENEENELDELDSKNKLYIIDSNFIEQEGKINVNKNTICFKKITYAGKLYNISTKKCNIEKTDLISYYCSLHRTTKYSNVFDKNNKKKKVCLCNGKIIYDKKIKKYFLSCEHSKKCDDLIKEKFDNFQNINLEINNYKNFRNGLIEFLNVNPMITYPDFVKESYKIYNNNNCTFDIKEHTFSNIYYNWRKTSNLHNKFCIFTNLYTNNNELFMRDYALTCLYSTKGTNMFYHEHIIFISNYFIKKISQAEHFYIDGTFVYPKGFVQLIVILYYDNKTKKRYPGLFALINNKKEAGYIYLLNSIKRIITLEDSKLMNLKSITLDFEAGLINAVEAVFPDIRIIGCFYHFVRAIKYNFKKLYKEDKDEYNDILKAVFNLPFSFSSGNITNVEAFCNKYREIYPEFIAYFETQWTRYFKNGILNYNYLKKEYRSNSYIENYNRRIKLKLSKYLFGKSKTKISWPLFIHFIRSEEEEYRLENINYDNSIEIKIDNEVKKELNLNDINDKKKDLHFNYNNSSRKWLKYNQFSCRYDTFFLLYTYIIKLNFGNNHNNSKINYFVDIYNIISEDILKMNEDDLNIGIWEILKRYKKNYDFLEKGFQEYYTIKQLFEKFKNVDIFCFKYTCLEGCSNCIPGK